MVHLHSTLYVLVALSLSALSKPISGTPTPESNIQCVEASCLIQTSTRTDISTTVQPPDLFERTVPPPGPSPINTQDVAAQFRQEGWNIRFHPYHFFVPIYTSSRALVNYMDACMAIVAAHMLDNTPQSPNNIAFESWPLTLTIMGRGHCVGCGRQNGILTWELAYYLLLYVRNRAAGGLSGTGALLLWQRDTTVRRNIMVSFRLRQGVGQTLPKPCRANPNQHC
ncbi:MAG: hypothetical protein LQ350_005412 [Teloschistes chrysophthalmus]|nr:MAG: hypothetical protein LQ350_005412 [Niorma chrysophthalma]